MDWNDLYFLESIKLLKTPNWIYINLIPCESFRTNLQIYHRIILLPTTLTRNWDMRRTIKVHDDSVNKI